MAPDATGPYDTLLVPRQLTELDDTGDSCLWQVTYLDSRGPALGIEVDLLWEWSGPPGTGIPFFGDFLLTLEVNSDVGNWDFIAQWTEEFAEQVRCRELPDPTPTLLTDPVNPLWPLGVSPGQVFAKWGGQQSPF